MTIGLEQVYRMRNIPNILRGTGTIRVNNFEIFQVKMVL
jgi:hypothetical protein